MDIHLDTSWCPVCHRQILPKRYLVPVNPHPPPAPAPPPSSPRSASPTNPNTTDAPHARRSKNATIRARAGGLVHGTGRVKPNGALKRSDSTNRSQTMPPKPAQPIKHRTVIDQGPIPLYCSDECQMADISNSYAGLDLNYDPHRSSPSSQISFNKTVTTIGAESDSSGTSVDSCSSLSTDSSCPSHYTHISPSIATLATMYNFPPCPPPAPVFPEDSTASESENINNYQSGIIMAGRRLTEVFSSDHPKRPLCGPQNPPEPRKPIPGWTDGSTAWRAALYSFSPPTDLATLNSSQRENMSKAYKSFSASPHRSRGVYSTLSDSGRVPASCASLPSKQPSEVEELYAKYSESLSRRSESRASLFRSCSPTGTSPLAASRHRERPILKPGAEGKLLVPNVKMRVHSGSCSSLSSALCSSYPASSRKSTRSTLSSSSEDDAPKQATSLPGSKKATVETRSWSYDNLKTYPIMQLPPKKEKRIETKMIDGEMVKVEVEFEVVPPPLKRLFLFPGKETTLERRSSLVARS